MQLKHATVLAALLASAGASIAAAEQPVIGLITKTETNPFFVKMKEGAAAAAQAQGAKLLSSAGKTDGDNAGQVTAIENMIAAGAKTILIMPSDSKAIVPAIKKARDKISGYTDTGVTLIAAKPLAGIDSADVKTGTDLCWGKKS
jgi:fructose transport system substrate-binding protein